MSKQRSDSLDRDYKLEVINNVEVTQVHTSRTFHTAVRLNLVGCHNIYM